MKKLLIMLCVCIFLFSFSGCGNKDLDQKLDSQATPIITEDISPEEIPAPVLTAKPSPVLTPSPIVEAIPTPSPTPSPEIPQESISLPNITKHPHDGTDILPVGGKTWFIANADNADGIRWGFLSPDGSPVKSIEETMLELPGLELEVLPEYTLALRNVPIDMNGWAVQAEFYNSAGSVFTDVAHIRVADNTSPYDSVFENCKFIIDNFANEDWEYIWANDTYNLLESRDIMYTSNSQPCRLGYVFLDLDNNGVEELIIGCMDENCFGVNGGNIILSLFGLDNGRPVKLISSWARNRNYLCNDGNILNNGSNSAISSTTNIYTISGASAQLTESLWSGQFPDEAGNPVYYYSNDGTQIEDEAHLATPEIIADFDARTASYTIPLPALTPIP